MALNKEKLMASIEAILFVHADPISAEKLGTVLEVPKIDILNSLSQLKQTLEKGKHGLKLITVEDKFQLCTKPEYAEAVKEALVMKKNTPLSQSALEILAVIAYNQPVTKSFVEQVRGVDCSWGISGLINKDLVEEKGRLNLPGRPITYGTTDNFLRCFNINSLDDLPKIESLSEENKKSENTQIKLSLQAD